MPPKKEKINKKNKNGLTLLHVAAEKGNLKQLQKLLKNEKIEVNCENDTGDTPLYTAVYYKKIDIVRELLKHPKINVNNQSKDGNTPLKCAIYRIEDKNQVIIKELLKHPKIELNNRDENGNTILYDLIQNDLIQKETEYATAKLLFENGAHLKNDFREKIKSIEQYIKNQKRRIKDLYLKIQKERISNVKEIAKKRREAIELVEREKQVKKEGKELLEIIKKKIEQLEFEIFGDDIIYYNEIMKLKNKDFTKQIEELEIYATFYNPVNRYELNQIQENKKISELKKMNNKFQELRNQRLNYAREIDNKRRETTEVDERERQTENLIEDIDREISKKKKELNELQNKEKKLKNFVQKIKGSKYDFNQEIENSQPSTSGYTRRYNSKKLTQKLEQINFSSDSESDD